MGNQIKTINEVMKKGKLNKDNLETLKDRTNHIQFYLNKKDYETSISYLGMQEATTREALNIMLEYEQIENSPYYYKIHAPLILEFINNYKELINISCKAIKEIHNTKASELPRKCKKNELIKEALEVQYRLIQCNNDLLNELYYILDLNSTATKGSNENEHKSNTTKTTKNAE